ncbi:transposase [Sphingomonas sp. BT-65]|uniref:transposase n=1 Tax=Sphingomonas sp. BT-65 TaxID=2989821 RepID=UPI0022361FCD|nr:transposase [Sphingomonas sp. BT-65]MCW4463466.1 transposase [Sphingomonas sp. BT-65]
MLYVLGVGCPWRDMHERYGKWNSVYVRFRRCAEQGVWDALLKTLVDLALTNDWQHMIDSTTVRGHASAAAEKGMLRRLLAITRRLYEQIHARCDNQGLPIGFTDRWRGIGLHGLRRPDGPAVTQAQRGCSPTRATMTTGFGKKPAHAWHPARYPARLTEARPPSRLSPLQRSQPHRAHASKLKQQRRIATRYDKPASRSKASSTSPTLAYGSSLLSTRSGP